MRLINASKLELESFYDDEIPPYAILSHRWLRHGEILFSDMNTSDRERMPAWPKLEMCCRQALADGLGYVWIDTCCIDKSSSAELSEAINSMYAWYSSAKVCYVYLNDVQSPDDSRTEIDITQSEWFTRAWTLQELIAPKKLVFYDELFIRLGSRNRFTSQIEKVTNIPRSVLGNERSLSFLPVAVRMSWAARRCATRTEDIAYSLFGIFGVNLPLLYGEGAKAFLRLQEEIIRQFYDHSIFMWDYKPNTSDWARIQPKMQTTPLLASSPTVFVGCSEVYRPLRSSERKPYAMTNLGLQIELRVYPYCTNVYVGFLDCSSSPSSNHSRYAMLLTRTGSDPSIVRRIEVEGMSIVKVAQSNKYRSVWRNLYIARYRDSITDFRRSFCGIHIDAPLFQDTSYILVTHDNRWRSPFQPTHTELCMSGQRAITATHGFLKMPLLTKGTAGFFIFQNPVHGIRAVKVGFTFDFEPVLFIATYESEIPACLQNLSGQDRYMDFEQYRMKYSRHIGNDEAFPERFWSRLFDYEEDLANLMLNPDGSSPVFKGIYAFLSSDSRYTRSRAWVFRPYKTQSLHVKIELRYLVAARQPFSVRNSARFWQFSMDLRGTGYSTDSDETDMSSETGEDRDVT